MRLSALRTSTRPSPTFGAASTSLDTRERQRTWPLSASSAMTSPSSEATTTRPPSVPTAPEMRAFTDTRQRDWPEVASMAATVPLREAAYTLPPKIAGLRTNCSEPPTLEDHITRTPCGLVSEGSSAGLGPVGLLLNQSSGFMLGMLEQAESAAASSRIGIRRRTMSSARISSTQGVQAHLHRVAERAAARRIRFLEREPVRGLGLVRLVLRHQRIAAQSRVLRGERRRWLRFQELERLVVGLLVDQQARKPQARDVLHLLRRRALDHPLQLRLGVLR